MLQELLVDLGDQEMGGVWMQNFERVLLMVLLHPSLVENLKKKICLQGNFGLQLMLQGNFRVLYVLGNQ